MIKIDLAAASRVASRVQLSGIHLAELSLETGPHIGRNTALEQSIEQECVPLPSEKGHLEVECRFNFALRAGGDDVATSRFKYRIRYQISGDEPPAEQDIIHFAAANGAYHAWPFVRELVYSLTSRIGFQPFILPVLSFMGLKTESKQETPKTEMPAENK